MTKDKSSRNGESTHVNDVKDLVRDRVRLAVEAALDKKALDLDVLHVEKLTSIADYFIICSASSERQTQAIADGIESRLREEKVKPALVEGTNPGRWILVDYGDFLVHIFTEECRRFYGLERLWGDAPNLTPEFAREQTSRNEQAQ
ncbi:MAG TPA: ribosome silencing factor [Thermoanaerobaculia bacterium]|nr:ribosome silencing factor [Thermoanaerobaculia bacterium]